MDIHCVVCYNETTMSGVGCQTFDLKADDIDDNVFEISRILLTVATFLGVFLTIFLVTSALWESINLKPVGLGFLLVYFAQAFSMLFFDTQVCHKYDCRMGSGCIMCIIASACWILTCLATAKMDTHKARLRRRRRRRFKRKAAKEAAAAAAAAASSPHHLCKRESVVTDKTSSSSSSLEGSAKLDDLEQLGV